MSIKVIKSNEAACTLRDLQPLTFYGKKKIVFSNWPMFVT